MRAYARSGAALAGCSRCHFLYCDLDLIVHKVVNDGLAMSPGIRLLIEVAERLRASCVQRHVSRVRG